MKNTKTEEKYGGLKYFQKKIWGSETFSEKNMGVSNIFKNEHGGLKNIHKKVWGSEK